MAPRSNRLKSSGNSKQVTLRADSPHLGTIAQLPHLIPLTSSPASMSKSLHSLFQYLATAPNPKALRGRLMDEMSSYFAVQRWGIYLLDPARGTVSTDVKGVTDDFVERYQQIGKAVDPVLQYVEQYHAPAHEEMVLPLGGWKHSQLYLQCCATAQHEHILTGPIVGQGQLIGTINFARVGDTPAFNQQDVANLSAICSHVSACLAQFSANTPTLTNPYHLTPRELEIAQLVAQGYTNSDIASQLWIQPNSVKQALKRMFHKTGATSRAEMVAKLGTRSLLLQDS
jgi:DNA-binding CsgD family transcriptional regulator